MTAYLKKLLLLTSPDCGCFSAVNMASIENLANALHQAWNVDVMFLSWQWRCAAMQFIWPMIFIMVSAFVVLGKDCPFGVEALSLIPVLLPV